MRDGSKRSATQEKLTHVNMTNVQTKRCARTRTKLTGTWNIYAIRGIKIEEPANVGTMPVGRATS